jgi:hypothetical protein
MILRPRIGAAARKDPPRRITPAQGDLNRLDFTDKPGRFLPHPPPRGYAFPAISDRIRISPGIAGIA